MSTILEPTLQRDAPQSSDRSFGLVFAAAFTVIAFQPLVHGSSPRWWGLVVAAAFGVTALVWPRLLRFPNRAWLALGRVLHRVVSPLILGVVFFVGVTPTGWIMRRRGKDLLSLNRRPDLGSYWIEREPAPPDTQSMKNQF